jgi:hypothetical protein
MPKSNDPHKRRGDIVACKYKRGNARTKQQYIFLENGFSQFGVTTNDVCESANNAILLCLR